MAVGQDGNYTLKRFLVLLIPVIVLLGWLYARGPGPAEVPFTRVVRETIVSTLNTNGKVEPIEWAAAHAEVGGPIQQIHVQRGQTVRKGQVLVTISLPDVQSDLSAAEARINAARAEIETLNQGGRAADQAEVQSGLIRAKSDLANAKNEYATLQRLAAKNAATKADVEAARQVVERAEQQIQSLERRRSSLVTQPDKSAAEARLQEAQSGAAAASQRLASAQVQSPMNGILYRLEVQARRLPECRRTGRRSRPPEPTSGSCLRRRAGTRTCGEGHARHHHLGCAARPRVEGLRRECAAAGRAARDATGGRGHLHH